MSKSLQEINLTPIDMNVSEANKRLSAWIHNKECSGPTLLDNSINQCDDITRVIRGHATTAPELAYEALFKVSLLRESILKILDREQG